MRSNGFDTRGRPRHALPLLLLMLAPLIGGCAATGEAVGRSMQAIGLKRADAGTDAPREVPLRLLAGNNLNGGSETRPLALVVKLYSLRGTERFERAPYASFLDEAAEREALGADLVESREILLLPGQRYEVNEALPPQATHIGVVALFRNPAPTRWRLAFDAAEARDEGVIVGLHACAMTTTTGGALVTRLGSPAHSLSGATCPQQGP